MQGRMNGNLERKGPHKSMHCKFCKPPGVIIEERAPYPQLETKTKVHFVHEKADLTLFDVHDEPGMPIVEREACVCVLEGDKTCPKCVPDKNRPPQKKLVCKCPRGAKPHPNMYDEAPEQKKEEEQDDEFWWEKYSREHDAVVKETWTAYMAQRKKDKKLNKCQIPKEHVMIGEILRSRPLWFQKLSCQQLLYIEYLSTAVRLDSDENVTDRTYFILAAIGLFPRPSRKVLKKCLMYCHYNALQFLNQLLLLTKHLDPFFEKPDDPEEEAYTWNEVLIMSAICHLELPAVLREIIDRMPPLPREEALPQIPYPVYPKPKKVKYETPYDEPLWQDTLTWFDKERIDRINRARAHMETKRAKIPALALVRRPSLIDNRPPFLSQIEANERASRRLVKDKPKKPLKSHNISTFNSAIDVTAIAGIEASDVSTTDKADTEDICVFLREPKRQIIVEEDHEPEELVCDRVKFMTEEEERNTQVNRIKCQSALEESYGEEEGEDIPFKTPPKKDSGTTIQSPCPAPVSTPGPPVTHYDRAKREIDIMNKDLCIFHPMVSSSTQTMRGSSTLIGNDIEENLKSAVKLLTEIASQPEEEAEKVKKTEKKKKKGQKKLKKTKKKKKKLMGVEDFLKSDDEEEEEEEAAVAAAEEEEMEEEVEEEEEIILGNILDDGDVEEIKAYVSRSVRSRKSSDFSDPDPDPDTVWQSRPPCIMIEKEEEEKKRKLKKKSKSRTKKKNQKKKKKKKKYEKPGMVLREESREYLKKVIPVVKEDKVTMTECYPGEYDYLYKTEKEVKEVETKKPEKEVYMGDPNDLVERIIRDLAEEGYICASFVNLRLHEDVKQLVVHLKGRIIDKRTRTDMFAQTKMLWNITKKKSSKRFYIPPLKLSPEKIDNATWNDKKWVTKMAKQKLDELFFKEAYFRALVGKELYLFLHFKFLGSDRYLSTYYAYMVSKYEDCVMKGMG